MSYKRSDNKVKLTVITFFLGMVMAVAMKFAPSKEIQEQIGEFSKESLGFSYTSLWVIALLLVMTVSLFFIWRQAKDEESDEVTVRDGRKIKQGKGSIYVEKIEGDFNINKPND